MTLPPLNDGRRYSRLDVARHATAEAALDPPPSPPRLAELEAERARTPPFDPVVLRAAAARVEDPVRSRPPSGAVPWWRRAWLVLTPALAVAALVLVLVRPGAGPAGRLKGDVDLGFYVQRQGEVLPGDPAGVFGAGDRLQFTYRAAGYDSLVLVSMDGGGTLSRYYPAAGDTPVPVVPGDRHVLDGAIELDDAPGPEVFVAVFGAASASEVERSVTDRWNEAGVDGLVRMGDEAAGVAVLVIHKP